MTRTTRAWVAETAFGYSKRTRWEPVCNTDTMLHVHPESLTGAIRRLTDSLPIYRGVVPHNPDFFVFRIRNVITNEIIPAEALGL